MGGLFLSFVKFITSIPAATGTIAMFLLHHYKYLISLSYYSN